MTGEQGGTAGQEQEVTPGRQRAKLVWSLIGVVAISLGIGIPIGLSTSWNSSNVAGPSAPSTPGTTPRTPPTTPTITSPIPRSVTPKTPPPLTTPPLTIPPAQTIPVGLSASEGALWSKMRMAGVDRTKCRGYPDGATVSGVTAALQCPILDPIISNVAIYYQFDGASDLASYIALRAEDVTLPGACQDGAEVNGTWSVRGVVVGPMVCIENTTHGSSLFKIVFASTAGNTAVIVQDASPSNIYEWWKNYAADQFTDL